VRARHSARLTWAKRPARATLQPHHCPASRRRFAILLGIGTVVSMCMAYKDAMADMKPADPTLPPDAVRRLQDGRIQYRDGSIRKPRADARVD